MEESRSSRLMVSLFEQTLNDILFLIDHFSINQKIQIMLAIRNAKKTRLMNVAPTVSGDWYLVLSTRRMLAISWNELL